MKKTSMLFADNTGIPHLPPANPRRFDLRVLSMVLILAVMWIFFRMKVGDFYFSGESIAKLSRDMVTWTILAAGMTLVIVSGNIDLSVGSLLAVCAAVCAFLISQEHGLSWSATAAVPIALLVGLMLGVVQGSLVAYLRIPSFIVTLAGLFIFRGLTQKISSRDPRVPDESWVASLGIQYVSPAMGYWIAGIACLMIAIIVLQSWRRKRRLNLSVPSLPGIVLRIVVPSALIFGFAYKVNDYHGIPNQTLVMIVVLVALAFIARQTRFGRHVFAIGGNMDAARLSGIPVERVTVIVFAIMGLLAGAAGVLWMAQNQGSTMNAGQYYELYAIAACVIGGTSLMGGRGTIFGTFLGALVMATVIQGMDYTNLDNWLQLVVRGAVLVLAVGIDVATKNPPMWMRKWR